MNRYFRRVVLLSVVGMLFTAISNANLGIVSQFASQNNNTWIGPLSISLVFLASGTGALYNKYIGKFKYKQILTLGAFGWNIFLSFSVMFLFIGFSDLVIIIIIAGSIACGFLMSMYYNGINNFVNQCGKIDNKVNSYFGLNICIIQCANIVGNGLSALLIQPLGQKVYSIVMLSLTIAISLLFYLTKQLPNQTKESMIQQPKQEVTFNVDNSNKSIPKILFFTFAFSGVMISFVYSQLSITFYRYFDGTMDDQELNKLTFTAYMIEGCGQFVGGLFLAVFASKMKKIVFSYFLNNLLFIASAMVMWYGFQTKQIWILNLAIFFVGFADCFGFALSLAMSSKWDQSGISLFNFGQSGTVAILSTLYIWIGIPTVFAIYGAYLMLSTFASCVYKNYIDNPIETEGQRLIDS